MSKKTFETQFPKFPKHIMEGVAKEFVDLYSPIRETPEGFLWLAFVTYLGNAVAPYVRQDCASSEPRFYGVVIGKSGRTRKSAGNNAARDLFKEIESQQRIIEGFGSAEGILVSLTSADKPEKPIIIHFDEINLLAAKTDIKGSAGIAVFHKLFEDHDYDHPLANGSHSVRNAHLSLIGASTLEDFTKTWTAKHEDAGFFSRLFLVAGDADKRIPRPSEPDQAKFAALVEKVQRLVDSVIGASKVLKMDSQATAVWDKFYEAFGDGPEWNRIDTYGFRLMTLQALLRGEEAVTKKNVQQVVDLLQYEVAVRGSVAPIVAENQIAQMEETIRRILPEGKTMTKRDLEHDSNAHRFGIELFRRAVGNMKANGEITEGQKLKSLLYTRVSSSELDDEDSSESVIGDVFDSHEDTRNDQKPQEHAGLEQPDADCLQYSDCAQPEGI